MPKAVVHLYQEPKPKRRKSAPLDDGLVAVRLKKGGARRVDPERAEAMRAGGLLAEDATPATPPAAPVEPPPPHETRAEVESPAEVTGGPPPHETRAEVESPAEVTGGPPPHETRAEVESPAEVTGG